MRYSPPHDFPAPSLALGAGKSLNAEGKGCILKMRPFLRSSAGMRVTWYRRARARCPSYQGAVGAAWTRAGSLCVARVASASTAQGRASATGMMLRGNARGTPSGVSGRPRGRYRNSRQVTDGLEAALQCHKHRASRQMQRPPGGGLDGWHAACGDYFRLAAYQSPASRSPSRTSYTGA